LQIENKEKLLELASALPEETLKMSLEIIKSMPVSDLDELTYCYYQ